LNNYHKVEGNYWYPTKKKRKPKRRFSRCVIHSQIETERTCGIEEYHMELSNCLPAIDKVQTGII
jgi:hypothetical protein